MRYHIILKAKFDTKFVTSFSWRKMLKLENLTHNILQTDEFYIVAKIQSNCFKTQ